MNKYRSNFEHTFSVFLDQKGIRYEYEPTKFSYTPKERTYTPDFFLPDYDIYIETKGLFVSEDRTKHLLVREQNPDVEVRFIFQNLKNKLYKGSKTTYADWCEKHEFEYAQDEMPAPWRKRRK